ncbi:hypothetical protein MTR_4g070180 [Medicago truncatula]|uniref:Uncharacterized protein n=1 Tax=Medicago truncatula TaxID=3880 RepID=G7JG77_MEDTR|nr:hypothetical protein MTR_4g070180 [Medicago truncatula]
MCLEVGLDNGRFVSVRFSVSKFGTDQTDGVNITVRFRPFEPTVSTVGGSTVLYPSESKQGSEEPHIQGYLLMVTRLLGVHMNNEDSSRRENIFYRRCLVQRNFCIMIVMWLH